MRKNFKHGKWVKAPTPHADISKYIDKQTGKEDDDKPGSRVRKEGSTMKFKKPKKGRGAGRAAFRGGGRTNLLEELGRVEGESSNRNRRAEVSRIHGELNKGYKAGGRIGLKSGGSPKGHKQPLPPDYWKDRLKDIGKRYPRPKENLIEKLGGSEKAKPHSTKEGRVASGKRRIRRILKAGDKPRPTPKLPRRKWPGKNIPKGEFTPLRAKHGIGSLVKKVISKIKPKPKPKEVDVDKLLKNLGDEIKAQPIPNRIQKKIKELQKAYPHHDSAGRNKASKKMFKSAKGKAAGGRIGLKHGGSAGAAIRGRGAEIK